MKGISNRKQDHPICICIPCSQIFAMHQQLELLSVHRMCAMRRILLCLLINTAKAGDWSLGTGYHETDYTSVKKLYKYGTADFVDCESCKLLSSEECISKCAKLPTDSQYLSRPASEFLVSGTGPIYRNTSTVTTPSKSKTMVPFHEYWCEWHAIPEHLFLDQAGYWNDMTIVPQFYSLPRSAKSICMSIQAKDYSYWSSHQTTTITNLANVWTPTHTPPCCNTYCNFAISSAQLLFWPTPAPPAMRNITTVVGANGMT